MRKIFLFIISMHMFAVNAQDFRFGATTGLNFSTPSNQKSELGFKVGAKGELNLERNLYLDFGLMLSSKPWKTDSYFNQATQQSFFIESKPYYLDIPVHIGYRKAIGESVKVFGGVGPYVSYGLFGKKSTTVDGVSKTSSDNIFKDKLQERFDWGVGANIGVELLNHYQFAVGYSMGLKDFNNKDIDKNTSKNRVFSISFAYMF